MMVDTRRGIVNNVLKIGWIFLISFLLTACGAAVQLDPMVDEMPSANDEPATQVQLPPTWTPEPTHTAAPATETPIVLPTEIGTKTDATPIIQYTPLVTQVITPASVDANWSGWQWVEGKHARFRLPNSYEIIDLGEGFGGLFALFTMAFTEGFSEMFEGFEMDESAQFTPIPEEEIEAAFDFDFIMAMESDMMTSAFFVSEPIDGADTMDSLLKEAVAGVEGSARLLSIEHFVDAPYTMSRAFVETRDPESGMRGKQVAYVIISGDRAYTVSYQTSLEKFDAELPTFEKSVSSFRTIQ